MVVHGLPYHELIVIVKHIRWDVDHGDDGKFGDEYHHVF
jgi:hypothetical protein